MGLFCKKEEKEIHSETTSTNEFLLKIRKQAGAARGGFTAAVAARVPRVLIAVATLVPHPPEVCARLVCALLRVWTDPWVACA